MIKKAKIKFHLHLKVNKTWLKGEQSIYLLIDFPIIDTSIH